MVIFPLAIDQTIAQMWSNGARGGDITEERDQTDIEDRRPRAAVTTKYQEDPCGSQEPRQTQQKSNLQRLQTM